MTKNLKNIIGLFTFVFLIMSGIEFFTEPELNIPKNLMLALLITGIVSLYGGILHLVTLHKRNL